MRVCQFNFNNEVDTFEIHVNEETGAVTIPGEGGQAIAEYASVQQLAELYAQARDVKPENLKNWVLLENGNVYSFILRAGTAGVNVADVEEQLEGAFTGLEGRYHALSLRRAKEQIMGDTTADLVDVLTHCTETDVARDIYDAMAAVIEGETAEPVEAEPEDTRSDLEKYIDEMAEVPGALTFIASLVGLGADVEKAQLLEALQVSVAFANVDNLRAIYNNVVNDARSLGIGVNTEADALTVITQTAVGVKDDAMKNRMITSARMAGRRQANISVAIVGTRHIRHTAELVELAELEGLDILVRDNVPYIVRFSDVIDDELEAERDAQQNGDQDGRVNYAGYENDDDDDEYDGDEYDDDEDDEDDEYDY